MPSLYSEYIFVSVLLNIFTKFYYEVLWWVFVFVCLPGVFLPTQNIHHLETENLNIARMHRTTFSL